jgi:hypothetical protein
VTKQPNELSRVSLPGQRNIINQQLNIFSWNNCPAYPFSRHEGRHHPFKEKIMNKIVSGMLAATLSVSFAAAAAVPANAAPVFAPQAPEASSNLQNVEARNGDFQWKKRHWDRRNFNGNRNFARNDGAYWNGHHGYREYRRGYRRHGDYWFPLAAFAAGALISGAIINNENNRVYEGNSHVQWCYDRYRSYRASDNTFRPYNGPRQQCHSPY